jgi:SAM-dependent methyltransferase
MSKKEHDAAVARLRQELSSFEKPWFKSCTDLLDRQPFKGLKCLDLGCGNCEFSMILRDRYAMDVTCADYIPFHLEQAEKEGFPAIAVDLDGAEQDVKKTADAYGGQFDLVVSLASIEHVFNSDNFIQFAHRVLKPGGWLLINTPNIGFLGFRIYSQFSGNRPFDEGHHVRFWDLRFLRTNLFFNGFEVTTDFRGFFSLPEELLLRALKNAPRLAKILSLCFYPCHLFQHIPFMKGLASDQLTVLCRRQDVVPIGFNYLKLKGTLEERSDSEAAGLVLARLQSAHSRGWLKEHIYITRLLKKHRLLME